MITKKNLSFRELLSLWGFHFLLLLIWSTFVTSIYMYFHWNWLAIPAFPLTLIGTALALYLGFKNNQSYDRLWEARKIWGLILTASRSWASTVESFVNDHFAKKDYSEAYLKELKQQLIYRQIAWMYQLRIQLLQPTAWEHINQGKLVSRKAQKTLNRYGLDNFDDQTTQKYIEKLIGKKEYNQHQKKKNIATQLVNRQMKEVSGLRDKKLINDFRQIEMQRILNEVYTLQGQCERIKNFPLPRQYGSMSFVFVILFIVILPFGMLSEISKLGSIETLLTIPFSAIVGWIFLVMELVGDYSENPFEGLINDIPMLSITRVAEIDLREILEESDIPEPIKPYKDVLM
ncbi:MAG: bestrophin family protein [Bacteroidota bacterium]